MIKGIDLERGRSAWIIQVGPLSSLEPLKAGTSLAVSGRGDVEEEGDVTEGCDRRICPHVWPLQKEERSGALSNAIQGTQQFPEDDLH